MDLLKAVEGIVSVRDRIATDWESPGKLSDLANKMAVYRAFLGDYLGELKEQRETEKGHLYLKYLKRGDSATAADNKSRAETAKLQGQIKRLELTHSDAGTQISIIQSRLKVKENEAKGLY